MKKEALKKALNMWQAKKKTSMSDFMKKKESGEIPQSLLIVRKTPMNKPLKKDMECEDKTAQEMKDKIKKIQGSVSKAASKHVEEIIKALYDSKKEMKE